MRRILIIVLAAFSLISCNDNRNYEKPKTAKELKAELKMQEQNNPLDYLATRDVTLQPQQKVIQKETFFKSAKYADDGALIEGVISNKASIATFKDVVVKVSYYSRTKTLIEEKSFVIYEYYEPGSSSLFSLKVYPPQAYDSYGFKIKDAKAVYD